MHIKSLANWIAIAESGSLTAAAKRVGLSQPALSRQLLTMEIELGAKLVERRPGGVALTGEGRELLEFARRTLDMYQELSRRIEGGPESLQGRVRIIASTTPGEYLVPELASSFGKKHPNVVTEVFVTDSAAVVSELSELRWDLGFVGRRYQTPGLTYVAIARDEIVLAVPTNHRFARGRAVRLSELAGQSLIEREDGSGTRLSVNDIIRRAGLTIPECRVTLVLGSTSAIVSAVRNGLGMGFVSARALASQPDAGPITTVRIRNLPLFRYLYLVHPTVPSGGTHVRQFLNHVRESLPPVEETPNP